MGLSLYWLRNDGLSGHVWLDGGQLGAIVDEMLEQRMAWADEAPGRGIPLHRMRPGAGVVLAADVEDALAIAERMPRTAVDPRLWHDWLTFLEGAAGHGGLIAR